MHTTQCFLSSGRAIDKSICLNDCVNAIQLLCFAVCIKYYYGLSTKFFLLQLHAVIYDFFSF